MYFKQVFAFQGLLRKNKEISGSLTARLFPVYNGISYTEGSFYHV